MPTEKEKMLNSDLYDVDDPELVAERKRADELTCRYNQTTNEEDETRRRVLDELFGSIDDSAPCRTAVSV